MKNRNPASSHRLTWRCIVFGFTPNTLDVQHIDRWYTSIHVDTFRISCYADNTPYSSNGLSNSVRLTAGLNAGRVHSVTDSTPKNVCVQCTVFSLAIKRIYCNVIVYFAKLIRLYYINKY